MTIEQMIQDVSSGDLALLCRCAVWWNERAGLFFFSSRRRHTRCSRDWSSDVCSSDLYVEGTAIGPFEGATVKVDLGGRVLVATGAVNSGQGHETSFAQVCADALGVPRSEEHTSELQSRLHLVCRLLLEKKKILHTDLL